MGEPGDGLRDPQVEATQAAHALAEHERQHVIGVMERVVDGLTDERDEALARAADAEAARDEARAGTVRVTVAFLLCAVALIYLLAGRALGCG